MGTVDCHNAVMEEERQPSALVTENKKHMYYLNILSQLKFYGHMLIFSSNIAPYKSLETPIPQFF